MNPVDYRNYAVLDLETTVNANDAWSFKAAPESAHNYIVMAGIKFPGTPGLPVNYDYIHGTPNNLRSWTRGSRLLVGHNIKFDLKYLIKNKLVTSPSEYPIWDTAIAEYMITGQRDKMISLNDLAAKYGLGSKHDHIKDLWDMGVKTENMDKQELQRYLERDLDLTEGVFQKQLELLDLAGGKMMREHIVRCSTTSWFYAYAEMEGMPIDTDLLDKEIVNQTKVVNDSLESVYATLEAGYGIPSSLRAEWDAMAPRNLGRALYGLPLTITTDEAGLRILKNGQPAKRKRKITNEYTCDRAFVSIVGQPVVGGNNQIQVPADLLANVVQCQGATHWANQVLAYRGAEKLLSTYLRPTKEFLEKSGTIGRVHPQFQLTTTNTGRTSCVKPNAQNMPPEQDKLIRPAGYGEKLVKADFKQLQIVGLALLTRDPQLLDDLKNGRDVHYETGKEVFAWTDESQMNKEDRRIVKNTNFGLIFGGTANGIAHQTGVDKGMVQQCINAFFQRYPKVKAWQDELKDTVEANATPIPEEFTECGDQVKESFTRTPLGRLLRFVERDVPAWIQRKTGRSIGFSPNEIVNYPVQGYSDADLVPAFLVQCNKFVGTEYFRPINMVHDAIWVLTSDPVFTTVLLNQALAEVNKILLLEVPLKLDISVEE